MRLKTSRPTQVASTPSRRQGFTMVEMLGVLAVLMVLATIGAENVLESIKNARRDGEAQTLQTIAGAFQASIVQNQSLPGASNWSDSVFAYLTISPDRVTNTVANTQRIFLYDPGFSVGTNATSVPPYTQGNAGSVEPAMTNARCLLISSLVGPLPTIGADATTFSNLWNTPNYGVPVGWTGAWLSAGADLHIQRMNLRSLFSRVVLENLDPTNTAYYSVGTNPVASVAPGTRVQAWLINSSAINFYTTNNSNSLLSREYIQANAGYTFEYGSWASQIQYGTPAWFGQMASSFLLASCPPGKLQRYSKQQSVADAMYLFLYHFGQWSLDNFSTTNPAPGQTLSIAAASDLTNVAWDLIR